MICILASYPRSGNTLARDFCWKTFGIESSSVYLPEGHISMHPEQMGIYYFGKLKDLSDSWTNDRPWHLVKTHSGINHPKISRLHARKAICVVRDGRASIVSYYHYKQKLEKTGVSLSRLISDPKCGAHSLSWSDFVLSWRAYTKSDILWLKYEDMVACPSAVAEQISDFLSIKPIAAWHNDFDQYHKMWPDFFRRGSVDAWKAEWNDELNSVFIKKHGECMRLFGYDTSFSKGESDAASTL